MEANEVRALTEQVEALVRASQEEQRALRRSSRTVAIASATILLIVGIFASINYNQFRGEWTEEKLAAGFQRELEVLQPAATREVQELGRHLLPVYVETGRTQFVAMGPEIGTRLCEEVDQLGAHLQRDANARLGRVTDRLTAHTVDVTFRAYPGLKAEHERDKLTEAFRETTDAAVTRATDHFAQLFATDVLALDQQIQGLAKSRPEIPTIDLEKRFIQLWLRLLDAEIANK